MVDLVFHEKNDDWTTSNLIAEKLDKSHKHVLDKIKKLLSDLEKLDKTTAEVSAIKKRNTKFVFEKYIADNGHEYERYKINKPAFSLFLMQMSGLEALRIQDTFNDAFYAMEQYILKLQNTQYLAAREQGKQARLGVTDSIKGLVEYATKQGSEHAKLYYATITKETYKALGYLAQGEKIGSDFRNHLDNFQLAELFIAESLATNVIENAIEDGLHYKEIYLLAKQKVIEFGNSQKSLRIKEPTKLTSP